MNINQALRVAELEQHTQAYAGGSDMFSSIINALPAISSAGLGVFIAIWYFVSIEPKSRNVIDNLTRVMNEKKQYVLEDFIYIAKSSVENTVMGIYKSFSILIDRNNIVSGIEEIKKEVPIIINRDVNAGREYLIAGNFPKHILDDFFKDTDEMKIKSAAIIIKYFEESAAKLKQLTKERDELQHKYTAGCNPYQLANEIQKTNVKIKEEYTTLKRRIWQVFEGVLDQVETKLNSM